MRKVPKFFNTAGPIQPDIHYNVEPLSRMDLEEVEQLIYQRKYFVLHAPRQTGKTSCLLALRDYLNARGEFIAVYANIEAGQAARNDAEKVVQATAAAIADRVDILRGGNEAVKLLRTVRESESSGNLLTAFIRALCESLPLPLVLFLDEIDALVGDGLVSVLRQIRAGYDQRPQHFPQTIVLCGVRDVRDYRIVLSNQDIVTGGSAFNIKAKSLRLGNLTKEEIHDLYMQHTAATGQEFDEACFPMIWEATEGQPWLVNALGYEVTMEIRENRDRSIRIIPEMIYRAQENIIYRRDTHIDILIDKLREDRVRRVIAPILANEDAEVEHHLSDDDIQYVVDMGLVVRDKPLRIANAIYKEIIPRELTWARQQTLIQQAAWYINPDNSINMEKLLLFRLQGEWPATLAASLPATGGERGWLYRSRIWLGARQDRPAHHKAADRPLWWSLPAHRVGVEDIALQCGRDRPQGLGADGRLYGQMWRHHQRRSFYPFRPSSRASLGGKTVASHGAVRRARDYGVGNVEFFTIHSRIGQA